MIQQQVDDTTRELAERDVLERRHQEQVVRDFNSSENYTPPPITESEAQEYTRSFFGDAAALVVGLPGRNIDRASKALFELGALGSQGVQSATGEMTEDQKVETMQGARDAWRRLAKLPEFTTMGVAKREDGSYERPLLGVVQDIADYVARFTAATAATRNPTAGLLIAGYSNDVEDQSLIETIVNALPESDSTKAVKEVLSMDPNKPDEAVVRRGLKAAEDLGLTIVGNAAINAAAEKLGKPAIDFISTVPEVVTSALMRTVAKTKNMFSSDTVRIGNVRVGSVTEQAKGAGFNISIDKDAINPNVDITSQLSRIVKVDVAGDGPPLTGDAHQKVVDGLASQLQKVFTEQMADPNSRVATAYQQRVDALAKAKKIGPERAKQRVAKLQEQELARVAEQEAANIYFGATLGRFVATSKAQKRAAQSGDVELAGALAMKSAQRFDEIIESALPFYRAVSSESGRALRQTQNLPAAARKFMNIIKETDESAVSQGIKMVLDSADNPQTKAELAEAMAKSVDMASALGGAPAEVMGAMSRALGDVGGGRIAAKDMWKAFESSYVNGILSSPLTHLLNHTSSEAMALMTIAERGIASAFPGGPKFKEAAIMTNEWMRSHAEAVILMANASVARVRALPAIAQDVAQGTPSLPNYSSAYKTTVTSQRQVLEEAGAVRGAITDTPGMTGLEGRQLMSLDKFDNVDPTAFSGKAFGVEGSLGSTLDMLGYTLGSGWVQDTMRFSDNFIKATMIRAEQRAFINRKVWDEDALGLNELIEKGGLDGAAVRRQVEDIINTGGRDLNFTSKFHDLGFAPSEIKMLADRALAIRAQSANQAAETALSATFQTQLGPRMEAARELLQDTIPGGRLIVPFMRTPVNLVNETLKRVPMVSPGEDVSAGLPLHPSFYRDFAAGGRRRSDAIARLTSGHALFWLGAKMYEGGQLRPTMRGKSQGESEFLRDTGLTDMSIVDPEDNLTIGISQYAPLSTILLAGAQLRHDVGDGLYDLIDGLNDEDYNAFQEKYLSLLSTQATYFSELPMMQGPSNVMSLLNTTGQNPDSAVTRGQQFAGRMAGAATPGSSLLAFIGRENDQYVRDTAEFMDFIKERVPGWRETLPIARDALWSERRLGENTYGPFRANVNEIRNDPVRMEMIAVGAMPTRPRRKVNVDIDGSGSVQVDLTKDQFDELGRFFELPQNNLELRLKNVIDSNEYQSLTSVPQKREMLMTYYRQFTSETINAYASITPEILDTYLRKRTARELSDSLPAPSRDTEVITNSLRQFRQ